MPPARKPMTKGSKKCDKFFLSGRVALPDHLVEVCVAFTTHFTPTADAALAFIELTEVRRGRRSFGLLGARESAPEGVTGVFHSDGTDGKDALLGPSIKNFFLEPAKLLVGTAVNTLKSNPSSFKRGFKETLLFALARQIIDVYHKYGYSADEEFYPSLVESLPSLHRYLRKRYLEDNKLGLSSKQMEAYIDTGELQDHVLEHHGITPSFNMYGIFHVVALMMEKKLIERSPNDFWDSTYYDCRGPMSDKRKDLDEFANYTDCTFKCSCLGLNGAKLPDLFQALSEHQDVLEDVEAIIQLALVDNQKTKAPAAQATPQVRKSARSHHKPIVFDPSPQPAPAPAPSTPPARPVKRRRPATTPVGHGSSTKKARSTKESKEDEEQEEEASEEDEEEEKSKEDEEQEEEESKEDEEVVEASEEDEEVVEASEEDEEEEEESEEDEEEEESEEDEDEEDPKKLGRGDGREDEPSPPIPSTFAESDQRVVLHGRALQPSSTTEGAPQIAGASSAASNASGTEISSAPATSQVTFQKTSVWGHWRSKRNHLKPDVLNNSQAAPATLAPSTSRQNMSPVQREEEEVEEVEAEEEPQVELTTATSAQRCGNAHLSQSGSTAEGPPLAAAAAAAVAAPESDSPGRGISMPECASIPPFLQKNQCATDNETTFRLKTQTCVWKLDKKEHIWSVVLDAKPKEDEKEVLFQLMEMCHRGVSLVVKGLFNLPKDVPLLRTLRNASLPDAHLKVVRYTFNKESKTYTELASVKFMKTVDFVDYIIERERRQMEGESSQIEVCMYGDRKDQVKAKMESIPPEDLLYGFDLSMPDYYPKLFSELRNNCPIPEMFSHVSLNEQYVSARV